MLHVFHVDAGRMVRLDVTLVTGPVRALQRALHNETAVMPNDQVST